MNEILRTPDKDEEKADHITGDGEGVEVPAQIGKLLSFKYTPFPVFMPPWNAQFY